VEDEFIRDLAMAAGVQTAHAAAAALGALDLRGKPEESQFFGAAKPTPFPHLADVTSDLAARDAITAARGGGRSHLTYRTLHERGHRGL
jgi:hypothetical protein